jgi:hypothetical protein
LIEKRTVYWQRIVSPSDGDGSSVRATGLDEILKRIESLELQQTTEPNADLSLNDTNASNKQPATNSNTDSLVESIKQTLQPQIDALNRAVRRYGQRAAAQSTLLDARLRHLDARTTDALALAAAAMRDASAMRRPRPKQPSVAGRLVGGLLATWTSVLGAVVDLVLFPWRLLVDTGGYFLRGPTKRSRLDGRGISYGLRGKGRSLGRRTS